MSDLNHECGIVAIYHLPGRDVSPLCPEQGPEEVSRLVPRMLLDIQNRGQLAAGMTTFNPHRKPVDQHLQGCGERQRSVSDEPCREIRKPDEGIRTGRAAIGHVRYATCGAEDLNYAQPFERQHLQKHKWFSFAFNGQLANYQELRQAVLADDDNHLSRDTDTEIFMHCISQELSGDRRPAMVDVLRNISRRVRRGLQPGDSRRPGRYGRGPRSAGHQAAVLCDGRTAVCRGQRKRGAVESRLRQREHQKPSAGPGASS